MKISRFITFLVILILGVFTKAQIKRFTYEYRFIPDSINKTDIKTEVMNLDISPSGSMFYSYTLFQSDSLMRKDIEKQLTTTGIINIKADTKHGLVNYSVSKKYPKLETYLHNRIFTDKYKVLDERPIHWKVSSEKQKIGEWNAQKAETDFAGRHWVAWFTTEIPIQDGPYKFRGLPGLIVRIEDATKSHIFDLKEISNQESSRADKLSSKEIFINLKQYQKLIEDYEKDPTKGYKIIQSSGITMKMVNRSTSHMKEQEKRLKETIKKDNNRIERTIK